MKEIRNNQKETRKVIIGILTTFVRNQIRPEKRGTMGIEAAYHDLFSQYGEVRIVTPDQDPSEMNIDLLVLPGGADISDALLNNQKFSIKSGSDNPLYTHFYKNSFNKWLEAGVPMFGICLGMQAINVMLGGAVTRHGTGHQLSDNGLHPILSYNKELGIYDGVPTSSIKRPIETKVNSRHHQFVRHDDLASGLFPISFGKPAGTVMNRNMLGTSKGNDYGTSSVFRYHAGERDVVIPENNTHIEAFKHTYFPIAAVQWHPEDMVARGEQFTKGDFVSHKLIEWLLNFKNVENQSKVDLTPQLDSGNKLIQTV
jgi:gamma-glutamyl-gamma-aminobutyrate hydrolase PuuD